MVLSLRKHELAYFSLRLATLILLIILLDSNYFHKNAVLKESFEWNLLIFDGLPKASEAW